MAEFRLAGLHTTQAKQKGLLILAWLLPRASEGSETRFGLRQCVNGHHPIVRLHKHPGWRVGIGAWAGTDFTRCKKNWSIKFTTMDEKPELKHHEAAEDPYAGLTPEDAECWRRFEGQEGKKVVRKVCCTTLSHVGDC